MKLGLIGFPLQQSLSPRLHLAALEVMGLEGEYLLYPVPPLPDGAEQLQRFVHLVRHGSIDGLNITLPHKRSIISFLDNLTPEAREIGAVNTLFRRESKVIGDNTDTSGFMVDLKARLKENNLSHDTMENRVSRPAALVLGAGGAARAVVYALWKNNWDVFVTARRIAGADEIISDIRSLPDHTNLGSLESLLFEGRVLNDFVISQQKRLLKVIINATPVGMLPNVDACPWPDSVPLPKGVLVYDLITKPSETLLMRKALQSGLRTCNGHGMLIEQAALSLERWTGMPVPRQAMQQIITDHLNMHNLPASESTREVN